MRTWLRRIETHFISLFSNVPFLYGLVIALGCLLKSMAGETAVLTMPVPGDRAPAVIEDSVSLVEDIQSPDFQFLGAVALPDGTMLVVGQPLADNPSGETYLMKYMGNGRPDPTFGTGGRLKLAPGKRSIQ